MIDNYFKCVYLSYLCNNATTPIISCVIMGQWSLSYLILSYLIFHNDCEQKTCTHSCLVSPNGYSNCTQHDLIVNSEIKKIKNPFLENIFIFKFLLSKSIKKFLIYKDIYSLILFCHFFSNFWSNLWEIQIAKGSHLKEEAMTRQDIIGVASLT